MRALTNYAGHRLSPWLGHLMVSRQETARPLLTPGEVMQLAPTEELILASGVQPIRAQKVRYYEDKCLAGRILPSPQLEASGPKKSSPNADSADDWTVLPHLSANPEVARGSIARPKPNRDSENAGIRREPALPPHEAMALEEAERRSALASFDDDPENDPVDPNALSRSFGSIAQQVALDPGDGLGM
jgi:type IV secretion system protein VirD4